jgi:hypothetical protein
MRKATNETRRLGLYKETVQSLERGELIPVVGGWSSWSASEAAPRPTCNG